MKKVEDVIVGDRKKGKSKTKNFSETISIEQPEPSVYLEQAEPE